MYALLFSLRVEADLHVAYRTLSIHVTDTVEHGHPATKGNVKELSELEWHKISAHETASRLRVNESQGLDGNQAERRLREQGKNTLSPPPKHRFRKM
jgi:sodium/potassium-transporting ATPase subunit alpha